MIALKRKLTFSKIQYNISDSSNIFLWHESENIDKRLISKWTSHSSNENQPMHRRRNLLKGKFKEIHENNWNDY